MAGRVLVGTCSWTDRTLLESGWYPPEARTPADRLRYYALHFPIVEVDSSYYALPSPRNAVLWAQRTPEHFVFDVKAFALFTHHPTPPKSLPRDIYEALPGQLKEKRNLYYRDFPDDLVDEMWRRFAESLLPLDSTGKLGVVLFQFPPWFRPGRESREYIASLRQRLPQYRVAIEFRQAGWLAEERDRQQTLRFLREHGLPLACVDEPQGFSSSVPPLAEVTAPVAIVRFHGRNAATWEARGLTTAERFNYLYSPEELGEWTPRIRRLAQEADEVHVLFNNCYRDYAVRNARQMAQALGQKVERQEPLL
ncbi:hypothetical protein HRbin24_01847 [bacterium HR24]|jgi:uncharacterized protein YecE (DUF72 family)|nr:hypothetical protein HRbin24_01847 [bacterium HR24]